MNISAIVQAKDLPLVIETVSVENFSSRGARIRARRAWHTHDQLVLTGALGDFTVNAKVIYCQQLGPDDCAIGLQFESAVVTRRLISDTGNYHVIASGKLPTPRA